MNIDYEDDKEFTAGLGIGLRFYVIDNLSINAEFRLAITFQSTITTEYINGQQVSSTEADESMSTKLLILYISYHVPF